MALFFVIMTILSSVSGGKGIKIRYADISVSVMEAVNSNSPFNTSHVKGVFGKSSLTRPVEGQLVHVHSENGSNRTGCENYTHGVPAHNWVALIERGTCLFSVKVTTATKRYNASAVIVYDNEPSKPPMIMMVNEMKEVYVSVNQPDGKRLAQLVDSGLHVQIKITAAAGLHAQIKITAAAGLHAQINTTPAASCSRSPYSLVVCPILSSTVAMLVLYFAFGQSE